MELSKSFTLIELLVVIAIIGILAGTIIVNMSGATDKATIAKSQSFASSVRSALGAGMVSEYRFDGTGVAEGGSATSAYYTDTWSQNNGTSTSNPTVLAGANCVSGSCLNFNGTNQCIHITDNPSFSFGSQVTIMAWHKAEDQGTIMNQGDYSDGGGSSWQFVVNGGPGLIINDGTNYFIDLTSSSVSLNNKWHLFGFTFNAGEVKLYLDGDLVQDPSTAEMTSFYDATTDLTIGCYTNNGVDDYFQTYQLDDIQIYNKAIPTAQIKATYYAGLNKLLANKQITDEEYFTRISKLEQYSATK